MTLLKKYPLPIFCAHDFSRNYLLCVGFMHAPDCVLYIDENKHLQRCPKPNCSRLRYFTSRTGCQVPVNVFRVLPIDEQIRLKFGNASTAAKMRLSVSTCQDASSDHTRVSDITESVGFKEVVFDSEFMDDLRNVVLLMATDGVNPFARERISTYSLWPFVFFMANLPRTERYKHYNMIVGGLVSGHVFINGVKKNRSVKNLSVYTKFFVQCFQKYARYGIPVIDMSYPMGTPNRQFSPKVMLLGTMGDYAAHCMLVCIVGAGNTCCCIKCNIVGVQYASVNTRVFAQHRRYTDVNHPSRTDPRYGPQEAREPPPARARDQALHRGHKAHSLKVQADNKVRGALWRYKELVARPGVTGMRAIQFTMHFMPRQAWKLKMRMHFSLRILTGALRPIIISNNKQS